VATRKRISFASKAVLERQERLDLKQGTLSAFSWTKTALARETNLGLRVNDTP